MRPEELFRIEDTFIPNIENKDILEEKESSNPQIDIFDKNLTLEDFIQFLNKREIYSDKETIKEYYENIITNNENKESIVNNIKEIDSQKEIILQQIEKEPSNKFLLKQIADLEEKLSDLNTEERVNEDNVKNIVQNIFKDSPKTMPIEESTKNSSLNLENIIESEISEINPQDVIGTETSEINPEDVIESKTSEINPEDVIESKTSEINPEDVIESKTSEINPEDVIESKTSEINPENFESIDNARTTINDVFEELKEVEKEEEEFVKNVQDNNDYLKEIGKNNKMIEDLSKNINNNFEILFKNLENIADFKESSGRQDKEDIQDIEPAFTENPKISQVGYVDQYRNSLRKKTGISPFLGIDTEFKADNLGSYV